MALARFVAKNALRNKRRSMLTVLSIAFSLLLLTVMMTEDGETTVDPPKQPVVGGPR